MPGGFGRRGTEGMLLAIKRAREHNVPFLGICLGFQMAVVEYSRNVCGFEGTPVVKTTAEGTNKYQVQTQPNLSRKLLTQ